MKLAMIALLLIAIGISLLLYGLIQKVEENDSYARKQISDLTDALKTHAENNPFYVNGKQYNAHKEDSK